MNPAQQKLWDAVDGSDDAAFAWPLLAEALASGAQVDCMRGQDFCTPMMVLLQRDTAGKAHMARALAQAGSNPLRDHGLVYALKGTDGDVCNALVEVCVEKGYTDGKGCAVLENLLRTCPILPLFGPTVGHALRQGAARTAPAGTTWLHVLFEREAMFNAAPWPEGNSRVGWAICEALLESGVEPTTLDQHGVSVGDLASACLRAGCPAPDNPKLLDRLLGAGLERDTPQVSNLGRSRRI